MKHKGRDYWPPSELTVTLRTVSFRAELRISVDYPTEQVPLDL